jgi:Zn-dependent M28 family amino/carboxypeptidase
MRLIDMQVAHGQRPAGSPQLRRLAEQLRKRLPRGRFEAIPGEPQLRNIVGTIRGRKPAIVLGAHYDTLVKPAGFVGANNGAAGSAIVIEAARALSKLKRATSAPEIQFVLFDGEEPAAGLPEEQPDFYSVGLRGSRAYVAAHPDQTRAMFLLDYVANKGAVFPDEVGTTITDDHTPFQRAGVPAVDFIDWSYDGHTLNDGVDKLSRASADAVGETVVELLRK